jgi:hypothetical protein
MIPDAVNVIQDNEVPGKTPLRTISSRCFLSLQLTKPDNTKQSLTSLVLAGIIWYNNTSKYCHQYDTSIAMASSQYDTDGLVSVWYCHSIHSGNFQKTDDS